MWNELIFFVLLLNIQLASKDTVVLKIAPSLKGQKPAYQLYVRAMFDYDPREDVELPCAELGEAFNVGDILEVVDATDFTWWQVRVNSCSLQLATGII